MTRTTLVAAVALALAPAAAGAQQAFTHGQNIAPVFEGWEPKPDGSFDMVFGFFNRNCTEVLHLPVGPDNRIEPGGPDRGQPTRFFPRRGKFIFRVPVPADFGDSELVWSLTAHGRTEKAYATLHPEYIIDKRITMMNEAGFGQRAGEAESLHPELRVEGAAERTVAAGEPLQLAVVTSDDGIPLPRRGQEDSDAAGLMFGWLVYRGEAAHVRFDPPQFNPDFRGRARGITMCPRLAPTFAPAPEWARNAIPEDGRVTASATFNQPGTYVLRAMAHDGGLKTTREITVNVTAPQAAPTCGGRAEPRDAASVSSPAEVPEVYLARVNAGDPEHLSNLFAEDAVFRGPAGQVLNGRAEIRAFYGGLLDNQPPRMAVGRSVADGSRVAFELVGLDPPCNEDDPAIAVDMMDVGDDGLIQSFTVFLRPRP